MEHSTVRAAILPEIISKIMARYQLDEDTALDRFYRSSTGESFADDDTGLYIMVPEIQTTVEKKSVNMV